MSEESDLEQLVSRALAAARAARNHAYAPYSRFLVGAAVAAADGRVVAGANVENASYGLTACAERIALWSAVSSGVTDIQVVAIVTDTPAPVSPCGACRQVLLELAPDALVVMGTVSGVGRRTTVRELLPGAFSAADLH